MTACRCDHSGACHFEGKGKCAVAGCTCAEFSGVSLVSQGGSILARFAAMFTFIGKVLSDPDVQAHGDRFFATLERTADRELATGDYKALELTEGENRDHDRT